MSALNNIRSVAKYESKLLMRSWFYRIFLILAVLFLCIVNFAMLISEDNSDFWMLKAISSNIPYLNLLFLNTGQAVIAVFLSSEFLKSDRKLDTSEVFYVHPLSNAEYVVGKIWGNLNVFFRLDLMIIAIVIIFNLASDVSVDWMAYATYFLLICVPTLIYIFGLSVSLMLILKNQAITFVILLGYIALTLFYIQDKFYYLFDYMVYSLPQVKSSIVGFTNWETLVNHRCIYLLLGLGFLCLSIFLFRRLPNTKYGRYRWLVLSGCFLTAGGTAAWKHVASILNEADARALYTEINNRYVHTPKMVIESYDIRVEQHPETISSEVVMKGVALDSSAVFTFCLNPSLTVREVKENDRDLSFHREHQIIQIDFGRDLPKGDTASFTMKYDGRVDPGFCYLDIPAEVLQQEYYVAMFRIDKAYGFQNDNYVLFTPETYWYPRPGTSYSSESPDWQQAYFSNFRLTVKTINGMRALSQGTMKWPLVTKRAPVPSRKKQPEKETEASEPDSVKTADTIPVGGELTADRRERPERRRREDSGDRADRPRPNAERGRDGGPQRRRERSQSGGAGRNVGRDGDTQRRPESNQAGEAERRETRRDEARRRNPEGIKNADSVGLADKERTLAEGQASVSEPETGKEHHEVEQMERNVPKDSLFIFETDFPSPSITLIIGDYEQKSIEVDSTEYSIWHLRGHDYFSSVFDSIADTIPAQIRERRRSIESTYSLDYSFKRLSIVEVPVQFHSYVRTWTQAQEQMQPEMILVPEKGCLMWEADVARRVKNEKRWAKWSGQDISDDEAAIRALNSFLWLFQRTEGNQDWSQDRGSFNVTVKANPYYIFPQLYNFRYNIFSSEWPIANRVIELYLQDKADNNIWIRQMNGISNNEKANLLMERRPFKELLSDTEQRDLLDNVISLKANNLFAPAERNIGYREYRDSLRAVLQHNIFTNIRFEHLLDTMGALAGEDLITPLRSWFESTPLPVYVVGTPEVMHISNRDKEVYVVKMQVTNDSDHDGIINIETNLGGRNDIYDPRTKRKVSLAARETKQLVSVWDEAPRNINVNTLISANLPNLINLPVSNIIRERNRSIDEEGDFVVRDVSFYIPGEVIVDNEDSLLFVLSEPDVVGLLPRWLDQVEDNSFRYSGVSVWRPPLQWTLTTNDKYYGTHVRSAYVIKSGSGSQTATWKIPVPVKGQYDLFYYVCKPDDIRGGRNRGGGNTDAEYHFKVKYDDDEENAYIDLRRSNEGWSLLGTYYFSEDTVKVTLANDCKLRSTVADAVKIVRR
ncbi:MAG: xanthan lyase [Tannerella sp.]|jgi:ABC-type transport system involved in multi-copper enzyme maturation permease subunit|nr:xanthan lyase [Tannerella sp.]